MKTLFLACILTLSCTLFADIESLKKSEGSKQINWEQLKNWYNQNKPLAILDARSKENFDGKMLPGATWLPFDSSDADIQKVLPSKSTFIVVYCCGPECAASDQLAKRLKTMGYTQVYQFTGGCQEWMRQSKAPAQSP